MSTDDSATAEIISDVQYYVGTNYCIVATFALVAYEYTITLPQEIELVWRSKMTSANAIFLLNRAVLLASAVVNFLNFFSWSTNTFPENFPAWQDALITHVLRCTTINVFAYIFMIMSFIVTAAFSALRTYAVSGRDWRLASVVLTLGLVPVATNLYNNIATSLYVEVVPYVGNMCAGSSKVSPPILNKCTASMSPLPSSWTLLSSLSVSIATRTCVIASDMIVLIVIWHQTYQVRKFARQMADRSSLTRMLMRDGSMYFVSLLLLNVLDMILWLTSVFEEFVQFFILPISSILISRCLLNLREAVNVPVECATMGHPSFVRSGIQASHTSPLSVKFASDTLGTTSIGDAQEFPSISTQGAWDGRDAGLSVIESNNDTEMAKPEC